MTDQSNAAQAAERAICAAITLLDGDLDHENAETMRAMLSKLRAHVADERAALNQILHSIRQARIPGNDWRRELALIENTATAALASAPVADGVMPAGMKEICPECGHQFECSHSPYIDELCALASARVAEERECGNADCGWRGTTERMCGSIGPLCPECGETTEASAPVAVEHPDGLLTLLAQLPGMREDPNKGDAIFRCGFNGALDVVEGRIRELLRSAPVADAYDPSKPPSVSNFPPQWAIGAPVAGERALPPLPHIPTSYLQLKNLDKIHGVMRDYARAALASARVAGEAVALELRGVPETIKEGGGFWRSCTGCHELNEGRDTGPYSAVLGCHLGQGCGECGGIGAIWDSTDYQTMADSMARDMGQSVSAAPQASAEDVRNAALEDRDE